MQRFYTSQNGTKYPLFEADHDQLFTVYRSHKKKATIGDPHNCIEALGLRKMNGVVEAWVGSGKDAIVVYNGRKAPYALHYVVLAKSARVRDLFDQKGAPATQVIKLSAPTKGRTYAARARLNKRRKEEIKNGAAVKIRGPARKTRAMRIGVPPRPRAKVTNEAV